MAEVKQKGVFYMTKRFTFFAFVFIVVAAGFSMTSCRATPDSGEAQAPIPAAEPEPGIHGNIHRIEYRGNVAYIFGSMHVGRPDWFPLSTVVESAMRRSDVFAFEFDLTQMHQAGLLSLHYALLPDGQTLVEFLPPDVYETFIANMSTYDSFFYAFMNMFTPMFLSVMVLPELLSEMNLYMEYSVDFYLLNFAIQNGRPVIGLNDLHSELSITLNLPRDAQIAVAKATQDRATSLQMTRDLQMAEMYEAQDLDALLELRLSLAEGDDAFSLYMIEHIVHARCRIFAAEITRLLRQTGEPTTFFITMGILHIIGGDVDTNVLGLLSDAGFEVARFF